MNKSTCKHYCDPWHNKTCKAGVVFDEVTTGKDSEPGSAFRKPCIDWEAWYRDRKDPSQKLSEAQLREFSRRGRCEKREIPTDEEIRLDEERIEKHMQKTIAVMEFLTKERRKSLKGKSEVFECPVCKGGLHVSVSSYNGHARVICETEDCVRWQE